MDETVLRACQPSNGILTGTNQTNSRVPPAILTRIVSATTPHNSAAAEIPPELVMRQLEGILSSEAFKNSSRLSRFLRYVVEHSLEGQTSLRERQIGLDVFDRDRDYDPRADPVVRVEARQLRFKLADYYGTAGLTDEILISLPKGGYAAHFERRVPVPVESSRDEKTDASPEQSARPKARSKWAILMAAIAAGAVVLALAYISTGRAKNPGRRARPTNPEARDLYLKGRYYWNKRTPEGLNQAVDYFNQAIARDFGYAQAYVGLADCYNLLSEFTSMPSREAFARASAAAKKAVELDDSSPEAHNALAFASFWGLWDVATADREFRRALILNPNYVQAHHWYATYLLALGRVSESLDEIERAQELDPSSTPILADKGLILFYADRKEKAITLLKQLEVTDPEFLSTHRYLRDIALANKDYLTYVSEALKTAGLSHNAGALAIAEAAQNGLRSGGRQTMLGSILQVQKRLYAEGAVQAYSLAQTCALLDEKQAAFEYLHRAFDRRESALLALRIDFKLRSLQNDPHYNELLKKVGLPLLQ